MKNYSRTKIYLKRKEIIKGIVSVNKNDGHWHSINLAEILGQLKRKVKNRFIVQEPYGHSDLLFAK